MSIAYIKTPGRRFDASLPATPYRPDFGALACWNCGYRYDPIGPGRCPHCNYGSLPGVQTRQVIT